ncbi:MAG TPA: SDR family NAD(P)-dependent oxidoreductase [Gammaproteobacteria bacterium]|nr:SDR family NAD(P)-dependent oxidoreductase [Gammaproteobacteria bacterium]
MKAKKKTILVTGGSGFIGHHLCKALANEGHIVRIIDKKESPKECITGTHYYQGDVRDHKFVSDIIEDVDIIFHLAAIVSIPYCQKNPIESYSNNLMSTVNLLEIIKEQKEKNKKTISFCFTSTSAIYGNNGTDGHALRENETIDSFQSFYAAQKHASEQAIKLYQKNYNIPAIIFRLFNVFGPGQDPLSPYSGVITLFTKFAHERLPIPLYGGGEQTRDFVSVYDIAQAFILLLKLPVKRWNAEVINLGTGSSITIRKLADLISSTSNLPTQIVDAPFREGDVIHSKADIGRAKAILDFEPKGNFIKILSELLR